jgi:hypothetical protein
MPRHFVLKLSVVSICLVTFCQTVELHAARYHLRSRTTRFFDRNTTSSQSSLPQVPTLFEGLKLPR